MKTLENCENNMETMRKNVKTLWKKCEKMWKMLKQCTKGVKKSWTYSENNVKIKKYNNQEKHIVKTEP